MALDTLACQTTIRSETGPRLFLVSDLSATCLRPAQNMSETWSKTWFQAGFEQDSCNGIWALATDSGDYRGILIRTQQQLNVSSSFYRCRYKSKARVLSLLVTYRSHSYTLPIYPNNLCKSSIIPRCLFFIFD